MKRVIALILSVCLLCVSFSCSFLNVCAASNVINVITEDFSSSTDCEFLLPGDMDADGQVSADDLVLLRQLLLSNIKDNSYTAVYKANSETAKFSDINGDKYVNIKDLVRQKRNSVNGFEFIADGVMSLNGNSAFNGTFTSVLATGVIYQVSLTYKSDCPVTVRMGDINKEIVFDTASKTSTVTKTFETPVTITDKEGIEFQIIGIANIENISVTRVNMDDDLVDNW